MKKNWNILKPIVYGYTVSYLLVLIIIIIYTLVYGSASLDISNYNILYKYIIIALTISIVPIIIYIFIKHKRKEEKVNIKKLLLMIPLGIGISLFYNMLTINIGNDSEIISLSKCILIIYTCILGPIFEEAIFRYMSLNSAICEYDYKKGIIIVSVIFALMHSGIINIIYAFILGLILGIIYYKEKNIIYPIVIHISANATSIYLTGFDLKLLIISIILLFISYYFLIRKEKDL